jgi:hypothetical protein
LANLTKPAIGNFGTSKCYVAGFARARGFESMPEFRLKSPEPLTARLLQASKCNRWHAVQAVASRCAYRTFYCMFWICVAVCSYFMLPPHSSGLRPGIHQYAYLELLQRTGEDIQVLLCESRSQSVKSAHESALRQPCRVCQTNPEQMANLSCGVCIPNSHTLCLSCYEKPLKSPMNAAGRSQVAVTLEGAMMASDDARVMKKWRHPSGSRM